jgi:hypothetical protein
MREAPCFGAAEQLLRKPDLGAPKIVEDLAGGENTRIDRHVGETAGEKAALISRTKPDRC